MRPGLAKIIEKVRISTYFESSETDLDEAENACWIDHTDTWSLKRVPSLSKSQSLHLSTTHDGCNKTLDNDTGVAQEYLPIARIHPRVTPESKIP